MRRFLPFLLAVTTLAATGCSGADAQRAEELLSRANVAMQDVRSASFSARVWTSGAPAEFTFTLQGGAYLKGKRAGDFAMRGSADGLPGLGMLRMVSRNGKAWVDSGTGGWTRIPTPAAGAGASDPLGAFDLTRYVTDVSVQEGVVVAGEPAAKITGVIDTRGLVQGALGQLGGAAGGAFDPTESLGDTRVALWVSERSHLLLRGLVDMTVKAGGEQVALHMDLAFDGYNERVVIPRVP